MGKKSKGFTEIKNRVLGLIRALGSLEEALGKKYWWIKTGFLKQLLSNTIKWKNSLPWHNNNPNHNRPIPKKHFCHTTE